MNYCKRLVGGGERGLVFKTLQRVGIWVHKSPLRVGLVLHFQCFVGSFQGWGGNTKMRESPPKKGKKKRCH